MIKSSNKKNNLVNFQKLLSGLKKEAQTAISLHRKLCLSAYPKSYPEKRRNVAQKGEN